MNLFHNIVKKVLFKSIVIVVIVFGASQLYNAIPKWHRKIKTNEDLKIGIITDTHIHPKRIDRDNKNQNAPRRLTEKDMIPIRNFVADMKIFKPDFIVHLGDVIEGTNDQDYVGIMGINLVKNELEKIGVPIYWAIGNHELRSLTKEQFVETLGLSSLTQSFDIGDYRFVILDANYNVKNLPRTPPLDNIYIPGHIPPGELKWLKERLMTEKQVFVFMHHGAFLDGSVGDYDEKKRQNKIKKSINNAKELQEIFKEYRVAGFFNGHMEARRYEKSQWTAYYSLTGTKKSKKYPDSYYELTITDGVPDLTMFYAPENTSEIRKIDFENEKK
jgi:alkaline phosphatase